MSIYAYDSSASLIASEKFALLGNALRELAAQRGIPMMFQASDDYALHVVRERGEWDVRIVGTRPNQPREKMAWRFTEAPFTAKLVIVRAVPAFLDAYAAEDAARKAAIRNLPALAEEATKIVSDEIAMLREVARLKAPT